MWTATRGHAKTGDHWPAVAGAAAVTFGATALVRV